MNIIMSDLQYPLLPLLFLLLAHSHCHCRCRRRRRVALLAVLSVVVELVAFAESAAAVGAEEVPPSSAAVVLPAHVALKVSLLEEAVAADRAHVRPLGQVVHAVVLQLGQGEEPLQSITIPSIVIVQWSLSASACSCLFQKSAGNMHTGSHNKLQTGNGEMGRMGRTNMFGQSAHFSLSCSKLIASPGR